MPVQWKYGERVKESEPPEEAEVGEPVHRNSGHRLSKMPPPRRTWQAYRFAHKTNNIQEFRLRDDEKYRSWTTFKFRRSRGTPFPYDDSIDRAVHLTRDKSLPPQNIYFLPYSLLNRSLTETINYHGMSKSQRTTT